jgi:hypothetical protein
MPGTGNGGILSVFLVVALSVSDPDPHSISRLDPDPGDLKRAKMKREKNVAKRQIIRHKKSKNQCNWYTNVYNIF